MRIVMMGTPDFAVPCLERLIADGHTIPLVVTQADKPKGRGHHMTPPPVKVLAMQHGIPVFQFEKIRSAEGVAALEAFMPELMVTAAFGQLLSAKNLAVPKYGTINVHGSLLPKYRGASPIQTAILNGDGSLNNRLQTGIDTGFAFYERYLADHENLEYYDRLRNLCAFAALPEDRIQSSGYVVDALEAAVWSLVNTDSFEDALLKAVNLGDDTDTVGAIAGGLAGLYYGYASIPEDWISAIKRREWIEDMCLIQE